MKFYGPEFGFCTHLRDADGNIIIPDIEGTARGEYDIFGPLNGEDAEDNVVGKVSQILLDWPGEAAGILLESKDEIVKALATRIKHEVEKDPDFQSCCFTYAIEAEA